MKKRILSVFIAFVFCLAFFTPFATYADSTTPDVSANDAAAIALSFVSDNVNLDASNTAWTKNTKIKDVVTLYDANGNITAYNVDLCKNNGSKGDQGYVVVSAYDTLDDLVTEYSDTAAPVYDTLNPQNGDKILYAGTLDYYKEDSKGNITNLDGNKVNKSDVQNSFKNMKNNSNKAKNDKTIKSAKNNEAMANNVEKGNLDDSQEVSTVSTTGDNFALPGSGTSSDGTIIDPAGWASGQFGGTFTSIESLNPFENYCSYYTMDYFSANKHVVVNGVDYGTNCFPTSMVNLMFIYKWMGRISLPSQQDTYNAAAQIAVRDSVYSYNIPMSTGLGYINNAIVDTFKNYGYTIWCSYVQIDNNNYTNTYNYARSYINAGHPMSIYIQQGSTVYGNGGAHEVVGYAYTRFQSAQTGNLSSFVKIMDGWNSSGRYLSLSDYRGAIYEVNLQ